MLSRGPSGDRIARSCRHTGPDLTVKTEGERKDRKTLLSQYVLGFWGPFQTMIVCNEIKQKQPQNRKTIFETLSLPVARSCRLSRGQAPTKRGGFVAWGISAVSSVARYGE